MELITIKIPEEDYEYLCKQAEQQFRTPAEQAQWLIHLGTCPPPTLARVPKAERLKTAEPLFSALRRQHRLAGSPSIRKIAGGVGAAPTTVYRVLNGQQVPSEDLLTGMVTVLGGDVDYFRKLLRNAG